MFFLFPGSEMETLKLFFWLYKDQHVVNPNKETFASFLLSTCALNEVFLPMFGSNNNNNNSNATKNNLPIKSGNKKVLEAAWKLIENDVSVLKQQTKQLKKNKGK